MPSGGCKAQQFHPKVKHRVRKFILNQKTLERATIEGDSPVGEKDKPLAVDLEYHRTRGIRWEAGGTTLQG